MYFHLFNEGIVVILIAQLIVNVCALPPEPSPSPAPAPSEFLGLRPSPAPGGAGSPSAPSSFAPAPGLATAPSFARAAPRSKGIDRISPTSGSLCGGISLSIYGYGFGSTPEANRVDIGDSQCEVETVSEDMLVCKIPWRDHKVNSGKESFVELVTVHANGKPMSMKKPLEFTFEAKTTPTIIDWGPSTGQASDVISLQGKDPLFGTSVQMHGRECQVKHSEGIYLQCIPPPSEAGISNVEVYFGPERGFACPGPKAEPLKFTYDLSLQSAEAADILEGEAKGPLDCGGGSAGLACGLLRITGKGLGNSSEFKLCGGDTFCEREGPIVEDSPLLHEGDWSFQSATCRPMPLDPSKAPGGTRTCDLTVEGANGLFVALLKDVFTYTPIVRAPSPAPAPMSSPGAAPGPGMTTTQQVYYIGSGAPSAAAFKIPPPIVGGFPPGAAPYQVGDFSDVLGTDDERLPASMVESAAPSPAPLDILPAAPTPSLAAPLTPLVVVPVPTPAPPIPPPMPAPAPAPVAAPVAAPTRKPMSKRKMIKEERKIMQKVATDVLKTFGKLGKLIGKVEKAKDKPKLAKLPPADAVRWKEVYPSTSTVQPVFAPAPAIVLPAAPAPSQHMASFAPANIPSPAPAPESILVLMAKARHRNKARHRGRHHRKHIQGQQVASGSLDINRAEFAV